MRLQLFGLTSMIVLAASPAVAQSNVADRAVPPGIVLLPGYEHEPLQGIDSTVGRIHKEGRLTIFYDIGKEAGNYATGSRSTAGGSGTRLWLKSQSLTNRRLDVTLTWTDARRLFVSFTQTNIPDPEDRREWFFANFWGTAETEEDMVEMLIMVLGYRPE